MFMRQLLLSQHPRKMQPMCLYMRSRLLLQPLNRGPYLVLQKDDKYFTLQLGAWEDKVSIDRLNPVISNEVLIPCIERNQFQVSFQ